MNFLLLSIGLLVCASQINPTYFFVDAGTMSISDADDQLPLYWGWFVQDDYSSSFLKRSQKILADSLQSIPDFLSDVQNFTKQRYISDILAFYTRENPDEVLHCTAMFNGEYPNYTEGAVEYANQPEVKANVGKSSVLHAIGWILTPRTFGARIKLESEQLVLWSQNDTEGNPPQPASKKISNKENILILSAYDYALKMENSTDQDDDILGNFKPTSGTGSRAHLTLGCAPGIGAVTTGYDLVDVIRLENSNTTEIHEYTLPDDAGWLRNYGNGQWVFYPKKQWLLQSTFLGYSYPSPSSGSSLMSSLLVVAIACLVNLLNPSRTR